MIFLFPLFLFSFSLFLSASTTFISVSTLAFSFSFSLSPLPLSPLQLFSPLSGSIPPFLPPTLPSLLPYLLYPCSLPWFSSPVFPFLAPFLGSLPSLPFLPISSLLPYPPCNPPPVCSLSRLSRSSYSCLSIQQEYSREDLHGSEDSGTYVVVLYRRICRTWRENGRSSIGFPQRGGTVLHWCTGTLDSFVLMLVCCNHGQLKCCPCWMIQNLCTVTLMPQMTWNYPV